MSLDSALPGLRRPRYALAAWAIGIAASLIAKDALAHAGTGLPGGFTFGFMHPLSGPDHLLAMMSVGLWSAFLGRPLLYVLPVMFPAVMVGGAVLGMFNVPIPSVEVGIALSVLVLGSCIALSLKAPVWVASLIVTAFAVFHGYAHGKELPSAADPIGFSLGFVFATGLLHVAGIGISCLNRWRSGIAITRGFGAIIAVIGIWFVCRSSTL